MVEWCQVNYDKPYPDKGRKAALGVYAQKDKRQVSSAPFLLHSHIWDSKFISCHTLVQGSQVCVKDFYRNIII